MVISVPDSIFGPEGAVFVNNSFRYESSLSCRFRLSPTVSCGTLDKSARGRFLSSGRFASGCGGRAGSVPKDQEKEARPMARANATGVSLRSSKVRGLAATLTRPSYRRLLGI